MWLVKKQKGTMEVSVFGDLGEDQRPARTANQSLSSSLASDPWKGPVIRLKVERGRGGGREEERKERMRGEKNEGWKRWKPKER